MCMTMSRTTKFSPTVSDQSSARYEIRSSRRCDTSFRANHSIELAALNLIGRLTYDLDNGKIPTNIYIYIYRSVKGIRYFAT